MRTQSRLRPPARAATTRTAAGCGFAVVLVVFAPRAAAGEPAREKDSPVCRITITDSKGFSVVGALVAFDAGGRVFCVRKLDGTVIDVPESGAMAVSFAPLEPAGPPPVRAAADRPAAGRDGRDDEPDEPDNRRLDRLVAEALREGIEAERGRMEKLNERGELAAHVTSLEERLRKARDVREARRLVGQLLLASKVAGKRLGREDWRRLIQGIEDERVRRALFSFPGTNRRDGPGRQ